MKQNKSIKFRFNEEKTKRQELEEIIRKFTEVTDSRTPDIKFQWAGGFSIRIFDMLLDDEVGSFKIESKPSDMDELLEQVNSIIELLDKYNKDGEK